jgi:hypothetical protein
MDQFPDLSRLFTERQPAEHNDYLWVPTDRLMHFGTSVPAVGISEGVRRASGLVVPTTYRSIQPIDFVYSYITAKDYMPAVPDQALEPMIAGLLRGHSLRHVITSLVVLNTLIGDSSESELANSYLEQLKDEPRTRLAAALASDTPRRWLLARQVVLRAMRYALEILANDEGDEPFQWQQAMILCHLTADAMALGEDEGTGEESDERYGNYPSDISLEIARNELFNRSEDTLSQISRTAQLWSIEPDLAKYPLRLKPSDLLTDATGLSVIEWLALGFAVQAHRMQNPPSGPMWMPESYLSKADSTLREQFLSQVSATADELVKGFGGLDTKWGFLPFEKYPLLKDENAYLLLDVQVFVERLTTSLYWFVFDHESRLGAKELNAWAQAFGAMFEKYVLTIVERLAPPMLDGSSAFYTEDQLRDFARSKHCDCAIDFGADMVFVEVVGGRMSVKARIEGDPDALRVKTEQLVYKKAAQLDSIISDALHDESELTGCPAPARRRYLPVIVNIGTYPVNPITVSVIEDRIREEGWFSDPRVSKLAIIDVSELELIEGLAESHHMTMPEIVRRWQDSDLHRIGLRDFLIDQLGSKGTQQFRSRALMAAWDEVSDAFLAVLAPDGWGAGE